MVTGWKTIILYGGQAECGCGPWGRGVDWGLTAMQEPTREIQRRSDNDHLPSTSPCQGRNIVILPTTCHAKQGARDGVVLVACSRQIPLYIAYLLCSAYAVLHPLWPMMSSMTSQSLGRTSLTLNAAGIALHAMIVILPLNLPVPPGGLPSKVAASAVSVSSHPRVQPHNIRRQSAS